MIIIKLWTFAVAAFAALNFSHAKQSLNHNERLRRARVPAYADDVDFDWLNANDFMAHLHTLSRISHTISPRKVHGYSKAMGEKAFDHFKMHGPQSIDHIVNLAHFYDQNKGRKTTSNDKIENVANRLRRQHRRERELLVGADSDAESITTCPLSQNPNDSYDVPNCAHLPCVKTYLEDSYEEYSPGYGGSGGYKGFTTSLSVTELWSGEPEDRTDTDEAALVVILLAAQNFAKDISEAACDAVPDDIDICVLCAIFEIPHPGKVVCEVLDGVLSASQVTFDTLSAQLAFQDGLVDAAEIEAAYEHTRNLLDKSCAIFDQAVCRCVQNISPGQGCDGIDSDCDDEVDECDEDQTAPTIDLSASLEACGSGQWFQKVDDAVECVTDTLRAYDDCQEVEVVVTPAVVDCVASTETDITVQATDACGNIASKTISILIDDNTPPATVCTNILESITTDEPVSFIDVGLLFEAPDTCGGGATNVTVEVYSNEIDDVTAAGDFCRFTTTGKLFCHNEVTENFQNNREGIVDPVVPQVRLYTVVVTGTDPSGLSSTDECTFAVLPENTTYTEFETAIDLSTQRFFVTSFSRVD
jgi:hypothetical protein